MSSHVDFDFDLMARLAKEDPAEFARRREEMIHRLIETFRYPEEGHRMQSEIDMERMRTPQGEKTYAAMAKRLSVLLAQIANLFSDIQAIAARQRVSGTTTVKSE